LKEAEGVFGLLRANASEEELKTAIHALSAGMLAGTPGLMRDLFDGIRTAPEVLHAPDELSPRETEVLQLLFLGLVNKEIAARLKISEHTVKYRISSIFSKLEATNGVEAIRAGIHRGLLEL
jgi:DNA-binding NarL/FixJ family response regulator